MKLVVSKRVIAISIASAIAIPAIAVAVITPVIISNQNSSPSEGNSQYKPSNNIKTLMSPQSFDKLQENFMTLAVKNNPNIESASLEMKNDNLEASVVERIATYDLLSAKKPSHLVSISYSWSLTRENNVDREDKRIEVCKTHGTHRDRLYKTVTKVDGIVTQIKFICLNLLKDQLDSIYNFK